MLGPLRPLFAWALLGYAALEILFTLLFWFLPMGGTFSSRAHGADFTTLTTIGFPLLALLIAVELKPQLAISRIVTVLALVEIGAVLVMGTMAFLVSLPHALLDTNGASALAHVVFSVAGLAFAALAGFACLRAFSADSKSA